MNVSLFEGVQVEGTIFREPDTYMDVELHILPLAEASEFVTKELGGKGEGCQKHKRLWTSGSPSPPEITCPTSR